MSQVDLEHHRLAFKLSYECGLSSTEVIKLKPDNINLIEGYINFKKRIIVLPEDFIFNLKLLPISKFCGARALSGAFKKYMKKVGMLDFTYRDLKNGFIINSLSDGKSIDYVNYICGMKGYLFTQSRNYYRQQIPLTRRLEILSRDDYKCKICGRSNKEVSLHVDHIKPLSKGGTNDFDNLQTLCKDCNHGKGGKALQTF